MKEKEDQLHNNAIDLNNSALDFESLGVFDDNY